MTSHLPGLLASDDMQAAIAASNLSEVSPNILAELVSDATRLRVPGGSTFRRTGDTGHHLELVVTGLVRIYVVAPDGRTLTVRYCRQGALLGVPSLFRSQYEMLGTLQALVDSDLLALRPAVVRRLADRDLAVAGALLRELSERVVAFVAEIPGSAFASVRQKIARHLLDLASERQHGPAMVAPVSQQELAAAVGTVREVVARTLRDLRAEGLVETRRDGIAVLAPERLYAELYPPAVGPPIDPGADPGA